MPDLISPIVGQQPTVPDLSEFGYTPFKDVQPFSQRAASGYQDQLEAVVHFLQRKLVPYLLLSNPQGTWDANVTALIAAVDAALTAQTTANAQAVAQALTDIANSNISITDPAMLAVLNTGSTLTRQWLDQHYTTAAYADGVGTGIRDDFEKILAQNVAIAPAPQGNGADDTAAVMAVLGPLHTSGATLFLQRGTYILNLDLPAQFAQVKIVGTGMRGTILKGGTATKPVVKFNGGSGSFGGGGLYECGITSADGTTNGVALCFSGSTGTSARNVQISGTFSEGVRFWNERTGDFTEFCTFEGDISGCYNPVMYRVNNTSESFHGSGLVGNTTINIPSDSTNAVVYMDKQALPYNAPMSFTVWFQAGLARLFQLGAQGRSPGRHVSFYGTIRVENHPNGTGLPMGLADDNQTRVLYVGGISWLGAGTMKLGNIYLCRKVAYEGGTIWADYEPVTMSATLKNSPTIIGLEFEPDAITLVAVEVAAPNYEFHALLAVQRSQFDGTQAFITEITRTQDLDSNNVGDPQFYFNGGLYCQNPNFTPAFTAITTATGMGGGRAHLLLAQN